MNNTEYDAVDTICVCMKADIVGFPTVIAIDKNECKSLLFIIGNNWLKWRCITLYYYTSNSEFQARNDPQSMTHKKMSTSPKPTADQEHTTNNTSVSITIIRICISVGLFNDSLK